MLVLSRKTGDEIHLPGLGVKIKLVKIRGKVASVGIEAPHDIDILRGELLANQHADVDEPRLLQASA
ncbi:carbon storage regulator [Pseudobythopirellula maris]|uniref:Translational regulator CsrA n=1 Tax=Pseudobythopirellula maris TaxID=2527991 RepID=A0A5C5ZS67_9BACT|nr:carbon storage regulator [Pseudobythopirellula maris]